MDQLLHRMLESASNLTIPRVDIGWSGYLCAWEEWG